jgi:hypothetical protein
MKTFKSKSFIIPLYGTKFVVSVAPNTGILKKKVSPSIDIENFNALTTYGSYKGFMAHLVSFNLFDKQFPMTHGLIAHECLHATNNVSKVVDLPTEQNDDEPTAYLTQWMVDRVYQCFKEWGVLRLVK